jgi:DNA-directed RNA polymerase specialized sigma24 family protein
MAAPARRATGIDPRACPKGAMRGVDVARMYSEIDKLVRAKYAGRDPGVDIDDLVQETVITISRRNGQGSAFDPARASFGKYVNMAASNTLGHLLGSKVRRTHAVMLPGDEALAALEVASELAQAAPVGEPTARTVGDLVEHLEDVVDAAREEARVIRRRRGAEAEARYQDGVHATARALADLLGTAFDEDAVLELAPRRVAKASTPATSAAQLLADAELLHGWRAIAERLGVGVPTARGFALRAEDPLPVEADHVGVCLEVSELEAWEARQRVAFVPVRRAA